MLLRKDLRGHHERGLPIMLGDAHRRERGHHRLAGADVALQEPHHRLAGGEIAQHLGGHPRLRPGEAEAEVVQQHPT